MTVSSYTNNYSLGLVDFNSPIWSDDVNRNWTIVDAVIASIGAPARFTNAVGTNALTLTYSPAITAYTAGLRISFQLANDPTGAMTVDVNGLGVKDLVYRNTAISSGDLAAGQVIDAVYDGTRFAILGTVKQEFASLAVVDSLSGATASADANQLTVEDNSSTGISILTPSTARGTLAFGNELNNKISYLEYNHLTASLAIASSLSGITVAPEITFDSDSGVYNFLFGSGTIRVAVATGTVVRIGGSLSTTNGLFIDMSNGRVGINTNSPTAALEVNGSVKASSFEGAINVTALTGTLPVSAGGTGGTTQALARDGLGLGDVATKDFVDNTDWSPTGSKLAVSNGGTGASTLTGYVKGSGTSPLTATASIPITDISGTLPFNGDASEITSGTFSPAQLGIVFDDSALPAGSYTLPDGLMIQWGQVSIPASPGSGTQIVNYTTPFTTQAFQVFISLRANPDDADDGNESFWAYTTGSLTDFVIGFDSNDKNAVTMAWFAIGI